jgi:hypothetical protein
MNPEAVKKPRMHNINPDRFAAVEPGEGELLPMVEMHNLHINHIPVLWNSDYVSDVPWQTHWGSGNAY